MTHAWLPGLWTTLVQVAGHLGDLHTYERLLVAVVAFGPFLVVLALVWRARRRESMERHERHERHERRESMERMERRAKEGRPVGGPGDPPG